MHFVRGCLPNKPRTISSCGTGHPLCIWFAQHPRRRETPHRVQLSQSDLQIARVREVSSPHLRGLHRRTVAFMQSANIWWPSLCPRNIFHPQASVLCRERSRNSIQRVDDDTIDFHLCNSAHTVHCDYFFGCQPAPTNTTPAIGRRAGAVANRVTELIRLGAILTSSDRSVRVIASKCKTLPF